MLSILGKSALSSSASKSKWNSPLVAWLYSLLATLMIAVSGRQSLAAAMPLLAAIQFALMLVPLIIMTVTERNKEYDKAVGRVMTVFAISLCLDLFRLR